MAINGTVRKTIVSAAIFFLTAAAYAQAVRYQATFDATWSAATHPQAFPANPHFSGLIGGTHNEQVVFWEEGALASPGIKRMAELGAKSPLDAEVNAAIAAGTAYSLISGGGIGLSPGGVSVEFEIAPAHHQVTLVSMIAPSPDWFVGVGGLSLRDNGRWLQEVVVELDPYDAGTDSGATYSAPNQPTIPPEPIANIKDVFPFNGTPPLGTMTFTLLTPPGDLNCDGIVDNEDIDPFVLALTDPAGYVAAWPNCERLNGDINGDGVVDNEDIDPFVALITGP